MKMSEALLIAIAILETAIIMGGDER